MLPTPKNNPVALGNTAARRPQLGQLPSNGSSGRPHWTALLATVIGLSACGGDSGQNGIEEADNSQDTAAKVSPVRNLDRPARPPRPGRGPSANPDATGPTENRGAGDAAPPSPDPRGREYRSFDGSDNNRTERSIGAANTPLRRALPPAYADGISSLAGASRPSARFISNAVAAQEASLPSPSRMSDFLWQWGQFLDHDLDLSDGTNPPEPANIAVPPGDVFFDPDATGAKTIALNRSIYAEETGSSRTNPRQQLNEITAWIDASNVYGSDAQRAAALRRNDGSGQLRTSPGNLLPFNTEGLPNAGGNRSDLFLAGDVRANEQTGLAAIHTLFVREHNRWASAFEAQNPGWGGERIYQEARRMVGAEMQAITYREFLPALLEPDALPPYRGYQPEVDASIANVFAHAAYRVGHTMLSDQIMRLDASGQEISFGHLGLRDAFFNPRRLLDEGGIEPVLRGLAAQVSQRIDHYLVDDVRNFLFGFPGAGGFDLASLNIQRGRDHGLPNYNAARRAFGLPEARRFRDLSRNPETQQRLAAAYGSPADMDIWVAGLAEDPLPGSQLGPLFHAILVDQFTRLRNGDRFWYQRQLTATEQATVEALRLADIIRLNTGIGVELADDVFRVRSR